MSRKTRRKHALSRFFIEKSKGSIGRCVISPYFPASNQQIKKTRQNKNYEPPFEGFSQESVKDSQAQVQQINFIIENISNSLKENHEFLGFSTQDIQNSSNLCDKTHAILKNIKAEVFLGFTKNEIRNTNLVHEKILKIIKDNAEFTGFSLQEQKDSVSHLTKSLNACESIRNDILRKIDRRVLKNALKEPKIVHSGFFSKRKLREMNASKRKSLRSTKCEIKMEIVKKEEEKFDVENGFPFGTEPELNIHNSFNKKASSVFPESPFFQIKKELIMPAFVPPKSPHYLIEEELYHDPWALLVATIFLNKTSCGAARPYVFWFLDENPDPFAVISKREEELETYFGALGLQKTRANQVWRMSHDFIYKKWKRVSELYGIGRYAEDAFRMFCLGDFSINPEDRYLKIYKAWYEMEEKKARQLEMNS